MCSGLSSDKANPWHHLSYSPGHADSLLSAYPNYYG